MTVARIGWLRPARVPQNGVIPIATTDEGIVRATLVFRNHECAQSQNSVLRPCE